jgi:hypothetical protein
MQYPHIRRTKQQRHDFFDSFIYRIFLFLLCTNTHNERQMGSLGSFVSSLFSFLLLLSSSSTTIQPKHIIDCVIRKFSAVNERRAFRDSLFLHFIIFLNHAEHGLKTAFDIPNQLEISRKRGMEVRSSRDRRARIPLVLIPHEQTAGRENGKGAA